MPMFFQVATFLADFLLTFLVIMLFLGIVGAIIESFKDSGEQ